LSALGKCGWVVLIVAVIGMATDDDKGTAAGAGGGGGAAGATGCSVPGYGSEQKTNAAITVAVGKRMNIPEYGQVIAVATEMQESGLRNLSYGDRDSLGVFQQRWTQGWGSPAQIRNVDYASTQFYTHLIRVPGWQGMSVTQAAQAVQHSGFPGAYANDEGPARHMVAAVSNATCN
jgi:hypothetical protein